MLKQGTIGLEVERGIKRFLRKWALVIVRPHQHSIDLKLLEVADVLCAYFGPAFAKALGVIRHSIETVKFLERLPSNRVHVQRGDDGHQRVVVSYHKKLLCH